jgi:hypothetical protein
VGVRVPSLLAAAAGFALVAGCGRIAFDPLGDVDESPWIATLGGGPGQTWVSQVMEDAAGDIFVVGGSLAFGPKYIDGWFAKLSGDTGMLRIGGVRTFAQGEGGIEAGVMTDTGVFVAGWNYEDPYSQQPVMGDLAFDGSWAASLRPAGELLFPGEFEGFNDAVRTNDGGFLLVGASRIGQGACATCAGMDTLVVRLRPDRSVEWVRILGSPTSDESLHRAVALPGGDFIVMGGGVGSYDYSDGAGTDIDSTPSIIYRLASNGALVWQRELRLPSQRGGGIVDAVFDPASGEVVLAGAMSYGTIPFIAQLTPEGAITKARELVMDDYTGAVTAVTLADDGGLFIAGFARQPPDAVMVYVARLDPDRESVAWAFRGQSHYSDDLPRMIRSQRGDLVFAANSMGPNGTDANVARIGLDGSHAACWDTSPAQITLRPVADNSIASSYIPTVIAAPPTESLSARAMDLPSSPMPVTRCSR